MMRSKLAVIVLVVAVVIAESLGFEGLPTLPRDYHEKVGIPTFARIKQYEQGVDFDGSRIAGGSIVGVGTQPHLGGIIVHLVDGRTSTCGASLLTNTRALTAAHCWVNSPIVRASLFTMVYGSMFLLTGGLRFNTTQVIMHVDWDPFADNIDNDIAIVVHPWVAFNNGINRILLPSGSELNQNFVGQFAQAAGYGLTQQGYPVANPEKRQTTLLVITNTACQAVWGSGIVIESTLCTSGEGMSNVCSGDSGGPLTVGSGNNRILIGVTSFGSLYCNDGRPSVFTRVTSFISWIVPRLF